MSISEQVKELRAIANNLSIGHNMPISLAVERFRESADTIEALSAKLQAANEELERWHTDHINEKIKEPFAWTSTLICHNCDHKDEYIEELEAKLEELKAANREQSAEDCDGGWIYCGDGNNLPEIERDILLSTRSLDVYKGYRANTEGYFYAEGEGYILYENVLAWMPQPEPYHEP